MSYCVRRLTTDHVNAVLDLESLVYRHANKGKTMKESRADRAASWGIWLDQEITYGVFDGAALACYANSIDLNPGLTSCYRIDAVNTDPGYRGKGFAKAVLNAALQEIEKKAPETQPHLYVPRDNTAARKLYEQFGFAARSETEGYANQGVFLMRMTREENIYPASLPPIPLAFHAAQDAAADFIDDQPAHRRSDTARDRFYRRFGHALAIG